jgi:hypothetical protein
MGDSESEKLCAQLSGGVGNKPADEFYEEFCLQKCHVFSEYFFKDMMQIFNYPGMEEWPKVLCSDGRGAKLNMSLVCFLAP